MVRWLEANGYDVSYFTDVDSDRNGCADQEPPDLHVERPRRVLVGRAACQCRSRTGCRHNLAFFSGNEIFWKTRWENSIDGSGTPYRTLVCYKETHANAVIDPSDPPTWTGTWRDPRFSPPADGGRPENALAGTIFMVNDGATTAIKVPAADGKMRFWRNTSIANLGPGQTATLTSGTLGYEWDEDLDNGARPAGLFDMSTTTYNGAPVLQDYGSTYASGTATHHLTLYRAPQRRPRLRCRHGAVVLGPGRAPRRRHHHARRAHAAGDGQPVRRHGGPARDAAVGARRRDRLDRHDPADLDHHRAGRRHDRAERDTGHDHRHGDGRRGRGRGRGRGLGRWGDDLAPGDRPRELELHLDARRTSGPVTIKSRAVDDSGNLETPGAGITVTVQGGQNNPSGTSIFSATATPRTSDADPDLRRPRSA